MSIKEEQYLLGYGEALTHLVKGYVGTGIFSMGAAFKNAGLILGPICVCLLGVVSLHCCHLLVDTSRNLHERNELDFPPDYAYTAEFCFANGPTHFRRISKVVRLIVNVFLVMAQLGFCCAYYVFIARNVQEILNHHHVYFGIHWIIVLLLIPILLTSLIRTLKYLAPFSYLANILLVISIIIVLYYAFKRPIYDPSVKLFTTAEKFPLFFGTSIFAFEGIGLILILYSEMKDPEQFKGVLGVLNVGLVIITLLYVFFGTITYLQYGTDIKDTVTLNLPITSGLGQSVMAIISLGVLFTYSLQMYVAVDILWPKITNVFGPFTHPIISELLFRTGLVLITFINSEVIPNLEILLSFVGSFTSVALILLFPAIMDLVNIYSYHELTTFLIIKNVTIIFFAIFGMLAGTYESLSLLGK